MRWLSMVLFRFDPEDPVLVLDVELESNGEKTTKRLVLDTGATYLLVPWEVAELLGIKPEVSEERIETVTASGVEKVPLVTIDFVRVLGHDVKKVKAIIHDLPPRSYVDGLLGLSFLRNFDLRLNFKEGYLELN